MRKSILAITALGMAAVSAFSADSKSTGGNFFTQAEAERQLAGVSQIDTSRYHNGVVLAFLGCRRRGG